MRNPRGNLMTAVTLAAAASAFCSTAVAAEVRLPGWPKATLAFTGDAVAVAWPSATAYPADGYVVYRADSALLPLRGGDLTGKRSPSIAMRTSAGAVLTATALGDTGERHMMLVAGRGFLPQVIYCCRSNAKDYPVESSSRADGPRTLAAALDGKVVRYVMGNADRTSVFVTRNVDEAIGQPFGLRTVRPFDAEPVSGRIGVASGLVAWVDRRAPTEIRTATVATGQLDPVAGAKIPLDGDAQRLHVTPRMIVALTLTANGQYHLNRYDAPTWTPTTVWSGSQAPGPSAAGDQAVVVVTGNRLRRHLAGDTTASVVRTLARPVVAVATDGTRAATAERATLRTRTGSAKVTAVSVTPLDAVPTGGVR